MKEIIDLLLIIAYFPIKNWLQILITFILITIFFVIDFIIWNKTGKSVWHKIIK